MAVKHENLKKKVMICLSSNKFLPFSVPTGMAFTFSGQPIKYGIEGHSDIVAYRDGHAYFIEIKILPDKQRATQKKFQKAVETHGCVYAIINDRDNINDCIKRLSK